MAAVARIRPAAGETQGTLAHCAAMTHIDLAPEVLDDFERFLEHFTCLQVRDAAARLQQIINAIQILADNPLIGHPVPDGLRELVIGRDSRGYVALYRYLPDIDTVFILALRAQWESGFKWNG